MRAVRVIQVMKVIHVIQGRARVLLVHVWPGSPTSLLSPASRSFAVDGEPATDLRHLAAHPRYDSLAAVLVQHIRDPVGDLQHLAFAKAARRGCRRADP